jgi:hypothetical protein
MGICRFIYDNKVTSSNITASTTATGIISSALKIGTGSATMTLSGVYTGSTDLEYVIEIDDVSAGTEVGQAKYKWSDDGGTTWDGTGVTTSAVATLLNNGISIAHITAAGADFVLADKWYFKANNLFSVSKLCDWNRDSRWRSSGLGSPDTLTVDLTSTGVISGSELITNGAFTANVNNWTAVNATLSSVAGGQAGNCMQIAETDGANPGKGYQDITTVIDSFYRLTAYFKKGTSAHGKIMIGTTGDEDSLYDSGNLTDAAWATSLKTIYFKATAATTRITFQTNDATAGETSLFDTVSCFKITFANVNTIIMFDHNLTAATLNLYGNVANTWGAPLFTQSVTYVADKITQYITVTQNYPYYQLQITDGANPDAFYEFSELFLGEYLQLTESSSFDKNANRPMEFLMESGSTPYGAEVDRFYNIRKSFSYSFPYLLNTTNTASINTMINSLGSKDTGVFKRIFFNEDSEITPDTWMIRIKSLGWVRNIYGYTSLALGAVESVKSV